VTEVERLLEAAGFDQTPRALRDRALLEVLYGCGARISEAVGLDIDDLELESGAVLLRGKGGKERLVPLGSYAREAPSRRTWCAPGPGSCSPGVGLRRSS
jgi:integrase/recombinase XerD